MATSHTTRKPYDTWPTLRSEPFTAEPGDSRRVEWAWAYWRSQDLLLASRDRQIEENIRMLAGRQWSVWSRVLGQFIDVNELLSNDEKLWRQRPVFNHLLDWFLLTHARFTENPPVITFQPSTADRADAQLAEIMDVIMKSLWTDLGMLDVIDRVVQILIPSGRAHWISRVDPTQGELLEFRGPAAIEDPFAPGMDRILPDVPYNREGQPLVEITGPGADDWQETGKAYAEHEGGLVVDPLSPLGVRGQWGHDIPWERKRWHARRLYLTPEEVFESYGVQVAPDIFGEDVNRIGELRRTLFGTGHFGAAEWAERALSTGETQGAQGYVDVLEFWHCPAQFPGMEERPDEPGGRLLTVSRTEVLRDGPRPAAFRYTSPIRSVDFVGLPGRPSGTSPQESMNAIQRSYNRQWASVLEHSHRSAHPIGFFDQTQGLKKGDITNEPGQLLGVNRRFSTSNAKPLEYAEPPNLSETVFRAMSMSREELRDRGSMEGAQGRPPTRDPSGELVKELRFNSDRYIGPASRRFMGALSRTVEDWEVIIPTIWDDEKIISWAGEDQVLRTVVYREELFREGSVNVMPDIESMLPEGRGERQARIRADWQAGAFGAPDSPEAIRMYHELARYPHMGRAHRPGGIHRVTAERENGRLAQGIPAAQVPVLEWYDHQVHIAVMEEFMSAPEYLDLDPAIQQEFLLHRQDHMMALEERMVTEAQREARIAAEAGKMQVAAEGEIAAAQTEMEPALPGEPMGRERPEGTPPGQQPVAQGGGTPSNQRR